MNRLNAKRIGVLAASLLFGLATAGTLYYNTIPIINSAGQPVVQIVVGSTAQPWDGVTAANIAAVIGNLAFTSTPVTATVGGTSGLKCVVTTATCAISNQQVWLGESGVAAPSGTYGFTALIGSVLNRGLSIGSPQNTKFLASGVGTQYGFGRGFTTTNSPADSPYTAAGYVPTSSSVTASSNGGGVSFTSFTSVSIDSLLQVSNANFPALINNAGAYGESAYLWLTGFPVYDQQTSPSVQNFAVLDAGGAWQAVFNKPIHQPYYVVGGGASTGTAAGANTVNNAQITILGQNWTIVSYSLPSGTPSSSTVAVHGGKIGLASSLVPLTTVYVGKNLTSGSFTVQLADLGTATSAGNSPAAINVYYRGALTNSSSIFPGNTQKYNITGTLLFVKVNQTFAGLYAYQKWAKIQMYSNVYNVSDGQVFNQTRDPGWQLNLLWVNTTGAGKYTDLQSIILLNTTPVTLTPGQSYIFIQNPQKYKVTLVGDTLGTNVDAMTISSTYGSSINYKNTPTNTASGLGNINNVTEPSQELVVTSQIPNSFSYSGQTSSSVTYLLTPYQLSEVANSVTAGATVAGAPVNVVLSVAAGYPTSNYISSTNPLIVTITGYTANTATSTTSTSLTFTGGNVLAAVNALQATTTGFYNITQIKLNRALPGVVVTAGQVANAVAGMGWTLSTANIMAVLQAPTTTPVVLYNTAGQVYYSTGAASSVIYNQQNGQPTTTFGLLGLTPVFHKGSGPQWDFYTYNTAEINVPANTASTGSFSFNIVNSTAGVSATPLFYINYSTLGTQNNVTYVSSTANNVNAKVGFVSERGSKVAAIGPTQITLNMAEAVDTLQFVVGPVNTTVTSSNNKVGPYGVGQATNLPNVTIANVTATCAVTGGVGGCTVSGTGNLTATPSIMNATTPVRLDTSATPLAVLDTNANSASTLIVIGSKFVNSVAAEIFQQNPTLASGFGPSSVLLQTVGSNRILVAGYYANQTMQAGNQFIQALLAAAH